MDSITQAALGAAIGDAAFGRKLGGKAALFGGICGLLPDLDMLIGAFGDEWTTMVHHRGLSHSLLVLPFVAPLAALVGWRWDGKRHPYLLWAHLAFWSLCTHPLLDWFTSYGTMLFSPASWHRYANDGVFIIDPVYSVPLFAALIWSWRWRKSRAESVVERIPAPAVRAHDPGSGPAPAVTAHHRRSGPAPSPEKALSFKTRPATPRAFLAGLRGPTIAATALALTTAYLLFGLGVTEYAKSIARAELAAQGFEAAETRAMPTAFFPLLRRVVARDAEGNIMAGGVSLWAPRPIVFTRFDAPSDELAVKALATEQGEVFAWFSDGYVTARVDRDERTGRTAVELIDRCYGFLSNPSESPFKAVFVFDADGRLESAGPLHRDFDLSFVDEMGAMWSLMWGSEGRAGLR